MKYYGFLQPIELPGCISFDSPYRKPIAFFLLKSIAVLLRYVFWFQSIPNPIALISFQIASTVAAIVTKETLGTDFLCEV